MFHCKNCSNIPCTVKLIRQPERHGLIKARLTGASAAQGDVIVFLDAHCECHKRWLEPMLARIAEDPTRVQTPVIENIDKDSFSMGLTKAKAIAKGVFDWVTSSCSITSDYNTI